MSQTPKEILHSVFGHAEFRPLQEEIIYSVLSKKDTVGLLPTGLGKTLCYQIPALMLPGITIVVSPLIALISDQIKRLQKLNIKVAGIYGNMKQEQIDIALDNCKYGEVKFLFLSPERLSSLLIKTRVKQMNIDMIVLDEAHCISQWGHDFRPSYFNVKLLREWHPIAPVLALTATATPKVLDDILNILNVPKANIFKGSYHRKQLTYFVYKSENKIKQLVNVVQRKSAPGIIYINKRKLAGLLAAELKKNEIPCEIYHAGLEHKEKEKAAKTWLNSNEHWMIATSAFGMGIDKANVRSIIHFHVPSSMEEYYQESGRAGRDGENAESIILYNQEDIEFLKLNIDWSFPERALIKKTYNALFNYKQIALGAGAETGFSFDLADFSKKFNLPAKNAYYAIEILEKCGYLFQTESVQNSSKIRVIGSKEILNKLTANDTLEAKIMGALLRSYTGLLSESMPFSESTIAERCSVSRNEVINTLQRLEQKEIVEYELMSFLPKIIFTKDRIDENQLLIPKAILEERKEIKQTQSKYMIDFVENKSQCRSQLICHYFKEDISRCLQCDNCLGDSDYGAIKHHIISFLGIEHSAEEIAEASPYLKNDVVKALRELMEEGKVKMTKELKFIKA